MEVFNDSILEDTKQVSPIIICDLKKMDPQLDKIKKNLTPSKLVAQGFFKNLYANSMTQIGLNKAYNAMVNKITTNIIPTMNSEVEEIVKIFQTSGIINRNESVPKDYIRIRFLGTASESVPSFVGVSVMVPYELDLKKMMNAEAFTEDDVKKHFDDIKGYWNLLENQGNAEGLVQLLSKINDKELEFYGKAKDYATTIAGKTLTRVFGVDALMCTSKGCRNIKYFPDPWISFCLNMCMLRIKDNESNWEVRFNLTSWESSKAFDSCTAKYGMEVVLYYKTKKKLFGCDFERNGITY